MSRMWMIEPSLLCDQHLLGEHSEMHQIVGTLHSHPHGKAIVEGHADKGNIDTSLLQKRHDALAHELFQRGYDHDSQMEYTDEMNIGEIDDQANIKDLRNRCEECRERIDESA